MSARRRRWPGGTGNGFARELGIPKELRPAVELICTGGRVRRSDVARSGGQYSTQRLYAGVEPERQTTRRMKERFGLLVYAFQVPKQLGQARTSRFRVLWPIPTPPKSAAASWPAKLTGAAGERAIAHEKTSRMHTAGAARFVERFAKSLPCHPVILSKPGYFWRRVSWELIPARSNSSGSKSSGSHPEYSSWSG